ncbi:MAG: GNAT family N-acetyltransferase [Candidatus Pacebacteria bacterium]|nr:GNAT family N-acetyltransferase [Candidatus Paceibacterota bacterium]
MEYINLKIKKINESLIEGYIKIRAKTDGESSGMTWTKGERPVGNIEEQKKALTGILNNQGGIIFLAYVDDQAVGYMSLSGETAERVRHVRTITVAVSKKYWRKGIGLKLMKKGITWAKANNIHKIHLWVWQNNTGAKLLYERLGFEIEGIQKDAGFINNKYVDRTMMGKILK